MFITVMKPFSILIPTYNRQAKLAVVLEALRQQHGIEKGEVIVGVDGSTDGTIPYLEKVAEESPYPLSWFSIPNSGRAVIRNRLIDQAKGDLLVFIQDDIIVTPHWLSEHLAAQRKHPGAVVGHMSWHPDMPISPYMRWLENGGHMLDFRGLQDGQQLQHWRFYMGNISIPRAMLADHRFDEDMKHYGWEDILLGYRFLQGPHQAYYSKGAKAYHWDEYHEKDLQSYMQQVGKSAVAAERKHPGVGFLPAPWKWKLLQLLIAGGRLGRPVLPQRWKWYLDMKQYFLEACEEALQEED